MTKRPTNVKYWPLYFFFLLLFLRPAEAKLAKSSELGD